MLVLIVFILTTGVATAVVFTGQHKLRYEDDFVRGNSSVSSVLEGPTGLVELDWTGPSAPEAGAFVRVEGSVDVLTKRLRVTTWSHATRSLRAQGKATRSTRPLLVFYVQISLPVCGAATNANCTYCSGGAAAMPSLFANYSRFYGNLTKGALMLSLTEVLVCNVNSTTGMWTASGNGAPNTTSFCFAQYPSISSSNYDHVAFMMPSNYMYDGCFVNGGCAGVGYCPGSLTWAGNCDTDVMLHELGHNLFLSHSGAYQSGSYNQYADTSSTMSWGVGLQARGLNAINMEDLQNYWGSILATGNYAEMTSPGTYNLTSLHFNDSAAPALKVLYFTTDTKYYIEYRSRADPWNGDLGTATGISVSGPYYNVLLIHSVYLGTGSRYTALVAILQLGQVWIDPTSTVSITSGNNSAGNTPNQVVFTQVTTQPTTTTVSTTTTTGPPTTTPTCNGFVDPASGTLSHDASPPRLGLYFKTSVSGCLLGIRMLLVNASATITAEAFSSSLVRTAVATSSPGTAGFVKVMFPNGGVAVQPNTLVYISYITSLGWRESVSEAHTYSISNGFTTYLNSWYQYPPLSTNAVVSGPYENTDYFVEPVFCAVSCGATTTAVHTTTRAATTGPVSR